MRLESRIGRPGHARSQPTYRDREEVLLVPGGLGIANRFDHPPRAGHREALCPRMNFMGDAFGSLQDGARFAAGCLQRFLGLGAAGLEIGQGLPLGGEHAVHGLDDPSRAFGNLVGPVIDVNHGFLPSGRRAVPPTSMVYAQKTLENRGFTYEFAVP